MELKVGEVIEVDGQKLEVVPMRDGTGLVLEPAITTMAEIDRELGGEPVSQEEFDRLTADLPRDDEG